MRHCSSEKVSSYKKVFCLKKISLSYDFLVYGSLHYNEPWPCPCLSTEWVLGEGHEGNFQDEKGPFWPLLNWFWK